jgi:hypothetical protein
VYALDGPVPWLSIDTRVVQVPRHSMLNTLRNDDPVSFVQAVIDRFRSLPNNEFHPFQQLSQDINTSRLELSDSVNGTVVDNFAFAKVRFRAPAGVDAHNVKVFFRLFTTAMTNLGYDRDTTYPRSGDGVNAVALTGTVGGAVASIPFYANARAANPATQTDPKNTLATLAGAGATEVVSYFGAWLDFNHVTALRQPDPRQAPMPRRRDLSAAGSEPVPGNPGRRHAHQPRPAQPAQPGDRGVGQPRRTGRAHGGAHLRAQGSRDAGACVRGGGEGQEPAAGGQAVAAG